MRSVPIILLVLMVLTASANAALSKERLAGFRRGVNLSHWYAQSFDETYEESRLASYMTERDFKLIKEMGFDHVRLTLDDTVLFDADAPGTLKAEPLAKFDQRLTGLLDAGVDVIVDLHPSDEYKAALHKPANADALVANWRALATHLSTRDPNRVLFEVLNEPGETWPTDQWQPLQGRVLAAIREAAPRHTVVVAGGKWTGADDLIGLEPYDDANVLYTFHWYEPFMFTHQSAEWGWEPAKHLAGLPWPVGPADAEAVTAKVTDAAAHPESAKHLKYQIENGWYTEDWTKQKLQAVADWQKEHGVAVYVGEFGAYTKATPPESRYRWYGFCAQEFKRHGWGWATWDYAGGFRMVEGEDGRREADRKMVEALGLGSR